MKNKPRRKYKFLIILAVVLGCLALSVLWLWSNADRLLTGYADAHLKSLLARSGSFSLTYSKLDLNLATGKVSLSDIEFSKDSIKASASKVETGSIHPKQVWKTRQLLLDYISVEGLRIKAGLERKAKADTLAADSVSAASSGNKLAGIRKYLDTIGVRRVIVNGQELSCHRIGGKMKAEIGQIRVKFYDLGYGVSSGRFTYCDSLYDLNMTGLAFNSANGLFALSADTLSTCNSGGVSIAGLHARNTVGKRQLSGLKGKVPVTWSDLQIKKLHTSRINLVRTVKAKKIELDSVFASGKQITLFRDVRHQPKSALKMPQDALEAIPIPLHIGRLELQIPYLTMENQPAKGGTGSLTLNDVNAVLSNFTNEPGSTVSVRVKPHLGKGRGELHLKLNLDKNRTFSVSTTISNVKGSDLKPLLYPMFGVLVDADIKKLNASVTGNRNSASGSFCMQYSDLQVKVDNEKMPYQKVADKAKLINRFAGAAIHMQNPRKNQTEPYSCTVYAKRDPMKNFGAYMAAVFLDGAKKTVLRDLPYKEVGKIMSGAKKKKQDLLDKIKRKKE